jgi:TDG/mug DNA glycosylase family protein
MSHRVVEEWMGEQAETLEDLLRPDLYAVCVGINPSTVSVERGHYYQGLLGQQFYARLRYVGLLPRDADGWEDDALFELGVGFTDIVKRATARADALSPAEFDYGRALLRDKLGSVAPTLVVFTFAKTAKVLFGPGAKTGFFDPGDGSGMHHFAMPGPYEKVAPRDAMLDELARFIARTRSR